MGPGDRALVDACLRGDQEAWERLHRTWAPALHRAALARLRDALKGASFSDADDVLQRSFAKLHAQEGRALASFDGRSSLGVWLASLVLREATDFARSERRARARDASTAPRMEEIPSALSDLVRREEAEGLHRALEALEDPEDRLLLRLVCFERASYAAAARILGVAEGSISPMLGRAREALRRKLEE